jgi:hypothetical protein
MRVILVLGILLGVAWGAYWVVGSRAVERGAAQAFAEAAARGLAASHEGLAVQGFPNRFDLTVTRPRLADPATGIGWTAPFAQVLAMTWKPWHVIAMLPPDQQIDLADERIAVTSSRMAASLRLSPDAALTFTELVIEGRDLALASDQGWQAGLTSGVVALARQAEAPRDYRLGVELTELGLDPALPDLGPVITRLHLDAVLGLTTPLDRSALELPPGVVRVQVREVRLDWGGMRLSGQGEYHLGPDGLTEGEVVFDITGWRQLPLLAAQLGLVSPEMAKSLTDGFQALASADGDAETLSLPLTAAEGWLSLGPLPLGPAPALAP